MKRKKIITFIIVGLMGNSIISTSGVSSIPVIDHTLLAKEQSNNKLVSTNEKNNPNITFYNIWGGTAATLTFNKATMKLESTRVSGDLGNGNNNYLDISYFDSQTHKCILQKQVVDGSSSNLTSLLNGKSFNYGDIIGINYEEGSHNPNISNLGNIPENGGTNYYEITENGLVKYTPNITINPLKILTGDKVTIGTVTGKGKADSPVSVIIGTKTFTGTTNANGDFSVNVSDANGFTQSTNLKVNVPANVGVVTETIMPSLVDDININNKIIINDVWNYPVATISFDPYNKKIVYSNGGYGINSYLSSKSEAFEISLYSSIGKLEGTVKAYGNGRPESDLESLFSNKSFNYGAYIKIDRIQSSKINITNFKNQDNYSVNGSILLEITKNGLVETNVGNVPVNPVDLLLPNQKVTSGMVTGKIDKPNTNVSVTVNGNTFTGESNSSGEYAINIKDLDGFTATTQIEVNTPGYLTNFVKPVLSSNYDLGNSSIQILNKSGIVTSKIKFNVYTNKFDIISKGSLLGDDNSNPLITLRVYNPSTNSIVYSQSLTGNDNPNFITNALNNKPFNYGDIIYMEYSPSSGKVQVNNGATNIANVQGTGEYFEITKKGLEESNLKAIPVNPFNLNLSTGKVTTMIVKGKIKEANQEVKITVGDKIFTGKTNSNGEYAINVSVPAGFEVNTQIEVTSKGYLPTIKFAVPQSQWGIFYAGMDAVTQTKDGYIEQMWFRPNTMTIQNQGNGFSSQLINGQTGQVIASEGPSNFKAFTPQNNLNGQSFKFGDIITVYESEETNYNSGAIHLWNFYGAQNENVKVGSFQSYLITANNGLTLLQNENLKSVTANFSGNGDITVSGMTLPNTKVKILYGDGKSVETTSNNKGIISATIPLAQAPLGSQVRVFLNNQNMQAVVVGYGTGDTKLANSNIEIFNSAKFQVMNLTFDPSINKFKCSVYPWSDNYTGTFYGNRVKFSLLNSSGQVVKVITAPKQSDIANFAAKLNNLPYTAGDILEVQYDKQLTSMDINNNKINVSNNSDSTQYFELSNSKGLVNVTNKFIKTTPLNILGNGSMQNATINGIVKPNQLVTAIVDGKTFSTKANSTGGFTLKISITAPLTSETSIDINSQGYIQTIVHPTIDSNITLQNSYINFYDTSNVPGLWGMHLSSQLASSIGFNPENNTFTVNNYSPNFGVTGTASDPYFTLDIYNSNGKKIIGQSFTGISTEALTSFLNGKNYEYGDIVALTYNPTKYKPVIVNNNLGIGNITGKTEYFKITKTGLVRTQFGNEAFVKTANWSGNDLEVTMDLPTGNGALNMSNNKLVLLNSNNTVLARSPLANDGNGELTGTLTNSELNQISLGNTYTIGLDANGVIIPIYTNVNIYGNNNYNLLGSNIDNLSISKKSTPYITINNSSEISTYYTKLQNNLNKLSTTDITNSKNMNQVLADELIRRVGVSELTTFFEKSSSNAKFLNWVLNNSIAMREFLGGPPPMGKQLPYGQTQGTYIESIQVWSDIWNTYTSSHFGFNQKLAISIALTNGSSPQSFPIFSPYVSVGSPVERYNIFENLNASGGLFKGFENLDVSHLSYVTNTRTLNNEILKFRSQLLQYHNNLVTIGQIPNIELTVEYHFKNPYTGGPAVYGPHGTMRDVWYIGGVCTEQSPFASCALTAFGIPSIGIGQWYTHEANMYYNYSNNKWTIEDNDFGWGWSYMGDISGWASIIAPNSTNSVNYTPLYQDADNGTLAESNLYLYLANSQTDYANKLNAINKAISTDKLNFGAWIVLVQLYHSNNAITLEQYNQLYSKIKTTFSNYPVPMMELIEYLYISKIEQYIKEANKLIASNAYTATSLAPLQTAVNEANTFIKTKANNKSITKLDTPQEVQTVINNIETSINDLKVSKTGVLANIKEANEILAGGLLSSSNQKALKQCVTTTENIVDNKNSTPAQISKANTALLNELNSHCGSQLLDKFKVKLNNLINKDTILLTSNGYMIESKIPLASAVNIAKTYLNEDNLSITGILDQIRYLNEAQSKLVVNISELKEYIQYYNPCIINNKYTLTSRNALEKAIITGENLINSPNLTGIDVTNAIANMQMEYSKLVQSTSQINNDITNELQASYWTSINGQNSLVLNANLGNGAIEPNTIPKILTIESSSGNVIAKINTAPVNWYSADKINYSGYQAIIPGTILAKLNVNESYRLMITCDGVTKPLTSNISLNSDSQFKLSVQDNNVVISKNKQISGIANCIDSYIYKDGVIINANIDKIALAKSIEKDILVTDSNGNIIFNSKTIPVNWYNSDKSNYSGLQAYIPQNVLNKLNGNEGYNLEVKVINGEKSCTIPLKGNGSMLTSDQYSISSTNGDLKLYKGEQQVIDATGGIESKYVNGENTVFNIKADIPGIVPKTSKAKLYVTTTDNTKVLYDGILVNWYATNKKNYNGMQFEVTTSIIKKYKNAKLYVYINNKKYSINLNL